MNDSSQIISHCKWRETKSIQPLFCVPWSVLWWWVQGESQREIRSGSVTVCDRHWEQGSQANSMVVGMATLASSVWVWHTVSSGVLPKLESFFYYKIPLFSQSLYCNSIGKHFSGKEQESRLLHSHTYHIQFWQIYHSNYFVTFKTFCWWLHTEGT